MATHYAELCAQSAAAFTGDGQRAWLTAIDQEHDNLRAALDWAVANDDAETALMIAGGASWPHWLRGTVIEGKRWLDDAFACGGRGRRAHAGAGADRPRAHRLPRRLRRSTATRTSKRRSRSSDATTTSTSLALAHSFYAEQPAVLGDIDEARRRRLAVLDFYAATPGRPVRRRRRARTRGRSWRSSTATSTRPSGTTAPRPRASRQLDRPVMNSMCLGMVADFDERAGDYPAAIKALEAAIATNETLLGGFTGSLLARLGWVLLQDGEPTRAEAVYQRALDSARRVQHTTVVFLALTGVAALHRIHGRNRAAAAAATEALEHLPGRRAAAVPEPRRHRGRPASRRRGVLRGARRDRRRGRRPGAGGNPARAGRAAAGRRRASRSRRSSTTTSTGRGHAVAALGEAAFAAAFERGQAADQGSRPAPESATFSGSAAPGQRAPGWWGRPAGRGPDSRRIS